MPDICNAAAYQFAALSDLKPLRSRLLAFCKSARLRGTILLSPEGVNLFVAGPRLQVEALLAELRNVPGLEALSAKFSESDSQPFSRMLVKIKREIIAFGVEGIDPVGRPSPKISATALKQWLDEDREVILLDTRNDYEVKLGTFRGALPLGIKRFRDFPAAVEKLPAELKQRPIVMFCTGGIRCEKAGPFMEKQGFREIYQLEGGILKYFEECGGTHYDGECFVFDQRVGVDPSLHETETAQCYVCQSPLSQADQADTRYIPGKSCPFCFKTDAEKMAESIARRHAQLAKLTNPLPGSIPAENLRPLTVPARCDGMKLAAFLQEILPHLGTARWEEPLRAGDILDGKTRLPADASRLVRAGERYLHRQAAMLEPPVNAAIKILHEDEALIVIDKPAPLPMHPGGRFCRNTLQAIMERLYSTQKPKAAHRLDANTTGVLLLTRTRHFASRLQPQFAHGEVHKTYLALVHGILAEDSFTCDAPIAHAPGYAGVREIDAEGRAAVTDFKVLRRDAATSRTLILASPKTGRTNQIRAHLWQCGHSIVGDPIYLPNHTLNDATSGNTATLPLEAPPLCLHSWKIALRHPLTMLPVTFEAAPPSWADSLA